MGIYGLRAHLAHLRKKVNKFTGWELPPKEYNDWCHYTKQLGAATEYVYKSAEVGDLVAPYMVHK